MPLSTLGHPSQLLVPISAIREGVVILKNGGIRAVLLASSINFALKSNEEQEAIITRFQEFLNSLDFSLQIVIQSRKFNINPYLNKLEAMEKSQNSELLRMQIAEYHDFVKELVAETNIMDKSFYVVVPYSIGEGAKKRGLLSLLKETTKTRSITMAPQRFHQLKAQLWQRVDHVAANLSAMGVRAVPLDTEELIELYYRLYNPDAGQRSFTASPEEMGLRE